MKVRRIKSSNRRIGGGLRWEGGSIRDTGDEAAGPAYAFKNLTARKKEKTVSYLKGKTCRGKCFVLFVRERVPLKSVLHRDKGATERDE